MVTNVLLTLLVLLAGALLVQRTSYDYMTVSPSDGTFDTEMSNYGAKGWKTESCRRASDGSDYWPTYNYEYIMSRAKLSF